jgi:hypothetical protein
MKFTIQRNEMTRQIEFAGSFSESELSDLNLCAWDRKIIEGAESSAPDSLLALELIFRRSAEKAEADKETCHD